MTNHNNPIRYTMEQASNVVATGTIGVTILNITVQDWAAILAGVWILLQMGWWIYSKIKTKGVRHGSH